MQRLPSIWVSLLAVALIVGGYSAWQRWGASAARVVRLRQFLRAPSEHEAWMLSLGSRCGQALFLFPTQGYIGFVWGDSFQPLHPHQGIDVFGPGSLGKTPVVAAFAGLLTRLPEWKSAVIIRVPQDPLQPGRQIWLYYTHMADEQGNSFIAPEFPPGTLERAVQAGALLGYQGNYSGDPGSPVGIHLHFSVVQDDGRGSFRNELDIRNTLDPSPYLGLTLSAGTARTWPILCR